MGAAERGGDVWGWDPGDPTSIHLIQAGICGSGLGIRWLVMIFLGWCCLHWLVGDVPAGGAWIPSSFMDPWKNLLSLGGGCSISDDPWEDGAALPSVQRDLIRCSEAAASLSLSRAPATAAAGLCQPSGATRGATSMAAEPPTAWLKVSLVASHLWHLQLINFSSSLFEHFPVPEVKPNRSFPRAWGWVGTGDTRVVALAVALSLAGQRCRAAVYYSGQVRLQHRGGSAAPRQLLLPGACSSFLPSHPGRLQGLIPSSGMAFGR